MCGCQFCWAPCSHTWLIIPCAHQVYHTPKLVNTETLHVMPWWVGVGHWSATWEVQPASWLCGAMWSAWIQWQAAWSPPASLPCSPTPLCEICWEHPCIIVNVFWNLKSQTSHSSHLKCKIPNLTSQLQKSTSNTKPIPILKSNTWHPTPATQTHFNPKHTAQNIRDQSFNVKIWISKMLNQLPHPKTHIAMLMTQKTQSWHTNHHMWIITYQSSAAEPTDPEMSKLKYQTSNVRHKETHKHITSQI